MRQQTHLTKRRNQLKLLNPVKHFDFAFFCLIFVNEINRKHADYITTLCFHLALLNLYLTRQLTFIL